MKHPIDLDLTPQKAARLRRKFRIGAEAGVLAKLSPHGMRMMERARIAQQQAGTMHDESFTYMHLDKSWWCMPDRAVGEIPVHFRVPFPGANLILAPLYKQLVAVDAQLFGPHPHLTQMRVSEHIGPVAPGSSHRVMIMHGDLSPELLAERGEGQDVVYLPQDKYAHMTAEWLRGFKGKRDSAYQHIRRNVLLRDRSRPHQTVDAGDEAYRRWYKNPRVQARLWKAPASAVVLGHTGDPHAGRPNMTNETLWRVFPRIIVGRPR